MKLKGDNEYIINRIVFWLEQVDQLKGLKRHLMTSNSRNPLRLKKKVSLVVFSWSSETELTQEATCYLASGINDYIDHLQNLIDEQNKDLIEIARSIHEGRITKKGR